MRYIWQDIRTLPSRPYTCGYCSKQLTSEKGYLGRVSTDGMIDTGDLVFIYVCHFCDQPTFFNQRGRQTPGPKYGNNVLGLSDDRIAKLYDEARDCIGIQAPTAAILSCRKLLMHVAVEKGAKPNLSFIEYVEHLSNQGYIPPDSKEWVDEIREKGNEANHEIVIMTNEDAKDLLQLTEMLLKIIYQFPSEIQKKRATKTTT